MYLSRLFLFLVFNSVIICQDCVTEDFENGIDHFTTSGVCQDFLPWKIEEYSSIDVEGPNPKSTRFILAEPGMKCISSQKFTMTAGGALEVNVYYKQVSIFDQLTVRVFKSIIGEDDILIGTSVYISHSVPAWDTISININGYGSFKGYITFQAFAISPNTITWIDSFRYIGPSFDKDSCLIYDEEMTTDQYTTITSETSDDITTNTGLNTTSPITEVSTTIAASTSTTPEEPVEDCLIEDFENNFDDNFTNNYGICIGFSAWDIEQYSFVNISNPHPRSSSFIAPRLGSSCVASYKFTMSAGGAIQVNVYMVPTSLVDQLTVTVFQSVLEGHDVPISRMFLNAMSPGFLDGWQILNVTVGGPDTFEGYVTFQALTFSTYPFIWVDSFRYIGPTMSMDSCLIYDDESTTTQTPITPTPEISTMITTGASNTTTPEQSTTTTSEATTTISSEAPTTTTTEAPNEDCLTEDFENNFDDNFTNDHGACVGFSAWDIQQYLSVNISSPHPESTSFIMPSFGSSCVASNKFKISAESKIQVNVYMIPTSPVDQLTVTVFQSITEGSDIPIGRVFLNAMSPGFVNGWQTLNLNIDEPDRFLGYVTFQAITFSSNRIIWIDSFRYIGPSMSMDSCLIYDDESTTTQAPITPTPEISTMSTTGASDTNIPEQSTTTTSEAPTTTTTEAPNEDCLTEDFENNFEDNFTNDHGACVAFSVWDIQQYLSVNISSPHPESTSFIMPSFGSSCVASNKFKISAGSKIQVNVYMIPTSPVDQLTVTVFQSITEGSDIPIGRVFLNAMSPGFVNGWQTLNLNIDEPDRFLGYVIFQAITISSNPIIWIDSFRYIGPSMSMDSCLIYDDESTTTQSPVTPTPEISTMITTGASNTTTPEQSTTTTSEAPTTTTTEAPNEDCLTEDFENNFEDNFTNDHVACVGFSVWDIHQYLSVNISSPHPESTSFIMPSFGSSCVASNKFKISARSKIQVNVYMIPTSPVDQLTVTVFQSITEGSDIPIGRVFLNAMSPGFVNGWQTLNLNIDEPDRFLGYVTFQAITFSSNPIILIDSYRYIGASMNIDSCLIYYEDESTTTQTPIPPTPEISTTTTTEASNTTTSEQSTANTTEASTTNASELSTTTTLEQSTTTTPEASTTISSEAPTTTTIEEPIGVCLTENFEENFEDNFTSSQGVCVGMAEWDIQQYSSVNISSPHPKSTSFIAPPLGSSCIASYKFIMATGGTLQVNLYMQPSSQLMDQLTVTVFQSVDGGKDIPVGRVFLSATSPDFVKGWQVLNIIIDGPNTFEGYVTFEVWALSINPMIWIDSFRYIGPSLDMDSCVIYAS